MTTDKSRADALTDEQIKTVWDRECGSYTVWEEWDIPGFVRACIAASPVEQPAAAPIDDFNGDTNSLIRSIMTLLEMDAAGALVPHGVGSHGRKLLTVAAARLAAVPPYEPGPKQPRQLIAQSATTPAPSPADERAAFRKWFKKRHGWYEEPLSLLTGEWDAWQAALNPESKS